MHFTPGSQRKFCLAETCSSFQGSCMNLHRKYKLAQRINSLNLESSLVRIPVQEGIHSEMISHSEMLQCDHWAFSYAVLLIFLDQF